jgi:hypothetical protein
MACLVKTNNMARAPLPGPMVLFVVENLSMVKEKGVDNMHLVVGVNAMDDERMDLMMDLERVGGKMNDAAKGNGGRACWPMDEGRMCPNGNV